MNKVITQLQQCRDEAASGTSEFTRGYIQALEFAVTLIRLEEHRLHLKAMGHNV